MKKDFKNDSLSPSDFTKLSIKVGDKVESIDLSEIEFIRVRNYPFPTTDDNGRILKRSENGEQVEISFEEKIQIHFRRWWRWLDKPEKQTGLVSCELRRENRKYQN